MVSEKILKFTDLTTWQEAHKLVIQIYKETDIFPATEQFGLTSQIRRAVISITSNIAEGFSRRTLADKIHFYIMAHGSTTEVQNQLLAARDIGFLKVDSYLRLEETATTVHKLITGLIRSLKEKQ